MAKYLSGKLKNLKVGLDNYSENEVVLDIVGIVSAKGGLKVGENLTMNADTGSISATSFIGDGSGLEGVVGAGSGVVIKDDNSLVGTAATINLGTNLVATPISAGIVTINVTPEIDLVNIGAQTLEVTGIATFKEDLEFISAGSTVAVFDISTGSLGIGSALPAAKLDVKGTIETDALKVVGIATIGLVTVYGTTGIVSATKYYGSGINLTGIGDTEYIDSASLRVNGITTVGFATANDVWVSGTVTATTFKGDLIGDVTGDVIGIATTALGLTGSPDIDVKSIVGTSLSISGGISTVGFLTATDVWVSGIVTATTFKGDLEGTIQTGNQPNITTVGILDSLDVTGEVSIGGVPYSNSYWEKNDVGINTSSNVGIGTTTPLADLQVGTGITMYGNTGIISATSFVGSGASLTALPLLTNSKSVITPNYNYQPPGTFTVYLSARYNVHFIHYYIDTGQWNSGVSADRNGYLSGADSDININLGDTIVLNLSTGDGVEALNEAAGPTWIKTGPLGSYSGDTGDDNGVGTGDDTNPTATNNGDDDCISTITWTPTVAGTYYYQNEDRVNMWGKIIVSSSPADLADSSFITDINFNSEGRVTGVVTFNGMLQAAKNARGIVQIYDDNNLTITTSGILSVSDSLNLSGIVTVSDTIKVGTAITASAGIITATKFVAEGSTGYLKADGTVDSGTFADGAIANVVDDTTPQLGGDLDGNSKNISGVGIITATSYYGDGQYLSNIVATGAGGQGGASIDNGSIVGTALSISGISTFTGNLNVDSNLFVGYSTSIHLQLGYDPYIQQVGTDLESSTSAIYNFSNATTSPRLAFVKSRSSDPNLRSKVNNGDELGRITFIGDDGSDIANGGAQISAIVDGTASATADMPARLSFYTAEDGTSWAKPRLTIKNTGDVAIGTITPYINASYTSLTVGGSVAGRKGLIELNDGSDVARAHLYTDGGDFKVSTVGTAGTIRFITGGSPTERLNITSAGKVGINSTSPTYALEVDGGTQNTVIVARSSDAKAAISFVDNTSGGYGRATIGGEGDEVYITSGAGVETLRITSDGDVGIGTDNPVGAAATTNNTKVLAVGIVTAQTYFGDGSNLTNVGGGGGTVESTGDFVGLIKEEFNVTAGKLSASPNIYLEDGMVHWFTTAETATSTPNIRYNGSTDLTTKMSVGQVATVTIITQSSGSSGNAYSANIEIDGDAVTEEWLCATAPSSPAATSGYNIYTHTIIKKGSSGTTADDFLVLSTVANYD